MWTKLPTAWPPCASSQEEASVYITVNDLHPFAHWVTPEIETRRFDTRFFLARMPDGPGMPCTTMAR